MKIFIYIVICVVAIAIVAGFFIVDSPKESRLKRFDERRVNDLSYIQSEIINYWIQKNKLPEKLGDLENDIRGSWVPTDPESEKDYIFEIRGKYEFSLCADFSMSNYDKNRPFGMQFSPPMKRGNNLDFWLHGVGKVCFERTIDPELYPQSKR